MKKDHPFKVPENYFEDLSNRIKARIEQEEQGLKRSRLQMIKPYIWMAASVLGIVLITKTILSVSVPGWEFGVQLSHHESQQSLSPAKSETVFFFDEMEETTADEIIEYLSDYDIETDDLLANL